NCFLTCGRGYFRERAPTVLTFSSAISYEVGRSLEPKEGLLTAIRMGALMVYFKQHFSLVFLLLLYLFSSASAAKSDTTPPTVSISSLASGTTYTSAQTVTLMASASDNVGVSKVEFYDGGVLKGIDTTSPYIYGWAITSANNGTHSWTAKAY